MLRILFLVTIIVCFIGQESMTWRFDRKPRIMGDKLPLHLLTPNRRAIQKKIVLYHNYFRSNVKPSASNMLRMKWHSGVARSAQRWADECKLLVHDNFTGRYIDNYGSCGQNIFVSSHQVPWFFGIKTWYLEKDNFTYASHKNDLKIIGHYTQLVWASSHEVGCGFAKCALNRDGHGHPKTFYNYVCNYCPIGNQPGLLGRPYRRGRRCGSCRRSCHMKKLCTNSCSSADLWANCKDLFSVWPEWLCQIKTRKGLERLKYCKATCSCRGKIHE